MTKTIAKKIIASNNEDMNIPNLNNSDDEQAFKSTESINNSTPKKMIEEIKQQR